MAACSRCLRSSKVISRSSSPAPHPYLTASVDAASFSASAVRFAASAPPSLRAFCTATANCLQCSNEAPSPAASVAASFVSTSPRASSRPAALRQCAMFAYTCSTDVRAHAARVSSSPICVAFASNHVASSTSTFGSGAPLLPLVRFHSASAAVISACEAFALPRIAATSVAGDVTARLSITCAAARDAAFSPSRSMPGFLFAGSATAASRARFAAAAASALAAAASASPTRSSLHRWQAHASIPKRFASAARSGSGEVTSKYFMTTSSPFCMSRAARKNKVCPITTLHALGAHPWLTKLGSAYTPTEAALRTAAVLTTAAQCLAKVSCDGMGSGNVSSPFERCLRKSARSGTGASPAFAASLSTGRHEMSFMSAGARAAAATRPWMSAISAPARRGATAKGELTHSRSPALTSLVTTTPRPFSGIGATATGPT
mmetsp:Transcript_3616/g.15303  ORF Transcript_3616/g.15303 Transcript_3616/m.15303 type:complete len:434 (+) Transcript_3616:2036-3337(+)